MSCQNCDDRGYLTGFDPAGYEVVSSFCTCQKGQEVKKQVWDSKMENANIFRHYFNYELQGIQENTVNAKTNYFVSTMKQYSIDLSHHKSKGTSYVITGPTNTGKTLLSSLVLKEALKKNYTAYYMLWSDILDKKFDDDEVMEKVKTSDFLVIDDLGIDNVNKESRYPAVTLENIIKTRYGNLLPTFVVSRLSYSELVLRFSMLTTYIPTTNVITL
jgi:DNA replication protein DnaC